jgi:transcriptional regulator with XRE-family HTH domain
VSDVTAAATLRAARQHRGLKQAELAARAQTAQADISLIERGRRDPSFDTLDRILRRTGHQLIAAPVVGVSGVQAAAEIRDALAGDRDERAFRIFIAYSDSLSKADPTGRVILSATAPAGTGESLWDAALAGVSDYWLDQAGLPKPEWLRDGSRTLLRPAPLQDSPYIPVPAADEVPAQFLARNVLVDETTLASI